MAMAAAVDSSSFVFLEKAVRLSRYDLHRDYLPVDADICLTLQAPPRVSCLTMPWRIFKDKSCSPSIVSTDPFGLLLLHADSKPPRTRFYILDTVAGSAIPIPNRDAVVDTDHLGLLVTSDGGRRYMLAKLNIGGDRATLLCYASDAQLGEWVDKDVAYPLPPGRILAPDGVVSHAGKLWWFDLSWCILACDPFAQHPVLQVIPLPPGKQMSKRTLVVKAKRWLGVRYGKLSFMDDYDIWTLADDGGSMVWQFQENSTLPFPGIGYKGAHVWKLPQVLTPGIVPKDCKEKTPTDWALLAAVPETVRLSLDQLKCRRRNDIVTDCPSTRIDFDFTLNPFPQISLVTIPKCMAPRPQPDMNGSSVIAAHKQHIVIYATMGDKAHSLFLLNTRNRQAILIPDPPADLIEPFQKTIGLVSDPENDDHCLLMAFDNPERVPSRLVFVICYSSKTQEWFSKYARFPASHLYLGSQQMFSHHDQLCWQDEEHGLNTWDPWAEDKEVSYIARPVGVDEAAGDMVVMGVSAGVYRWVLINGFPDDPMISYWSLDPDSDMWNQRWRLNFEVKDIWVGKSANKSILQREKMKALMVHPSNTNEVLFVHDRTLYLADVSCKKIMRRAELSADQLKSSCPLHLWEIPQELNDWEARIALEQSGEQLYGRPRPLISETDTV